MNWKWTAAKVEQFSQRSKFGTTTINQLLWILHRLNSISRYRGVRPPRPADHDSSDDVR